MAGEGQAISDEAALYEVAYEEAARALSEQLSLIDSFRTRAGLLLSAAAITTSVLGAQALDHGPIGYVAWAALASFFAVAVLSLAILWPRPRELGADSMKIIEECVGMDEPKWVGDVHRALALRVQRSCETNQRDLVQMAILFEVVGGLLAIEILAWIMAIAQVG